jgi:hypothetical protein
MNLKKFGTVLVVVLALGAVMASSAFAAATTTDTKWTWNGAVLGEGSANAKTLTAGLVEGTKGVLASEIGETALTLESTGLECIECKIENPTGGGSATGTGKLKFTGITVASNPNCQVTGGSVTTNLLTVDPDYMISTTNYALFKPNTGTAFATVPIVKKTGLTCPIAGNYIVSGTVFVQTQNATGVTARIQKVNSSGTINSTAGGSLTFGTKPATLTGEAFFDAGAGNEFGTESK